MIGDNKHIRGGTEPAAVELGEDEAEIGVAAFDGGERLAGARTSGMLRAVGLGEPQLGKRGHAVLPQNLQQGTRRPGVAGQLVFAAGFAPARGGKGAEGRGQF